MMIEARLISRDLKKFRLPVTVESTQPFKNGTGPSKWSKKINHETFKDGRHKSDEKWMIDDRPTHKKLVIENDGSVVR